MNFAENPVGNIVGPQYCAPYQMDLTIKKKKTFSSSPYKFVVTDDSNNIIFNVKAISFSLHSKKVIFDAAGNPILTLYCKIFSGTWKAFRGESSDEKDLIFRAKGSTIFHPKTKFNVYKANNNSSQHVPDFKVKGSLYKKASMAIYAGDSSTIVAQVQNKLKDLAVSRKKTVVTVYPNIDHAFVAAMVVLLATLLSTDSGGGGGGDGGGGGGGGCGGGG